jgi:hypothetical protein
MMLAAAPRFTIAEPLPGYRTQERIGAGGYGEVWRAEAPGGIAKAIKVIYGRQDDERALRELSALNRIREVRHPFLLSLERIELVDGHLVIVTELATSSLKEVCERYRQAGLCGVPRVELLAHLRDAADALDYIGQQHNLQHLDVKPENLLFVGGRIKVADFGLVKDIQDIHSSIVTGLTPVYAAPELFDGRPTIHSDQYSLAIVYQEMLTGELPYQGRTTAQLAAQHLHSRPRLERLPLADQAVIARALAKNPDERFASCREMIDGLLGATPNLTPALRPADHDLPGAAPLGSEGFPGEAAADEAGASRPSRTQSIAAVLAACDLPPLDLDAKEGQYGPTIFVGVGGLAARTLRELRGRLADRFGDVAAVPALQMLLFDTDVDALKLATEGDSRTALPDDSAILLPLRQPTEYRNELSHRLRWLSRRWIYNIPRSLQTQNLRPLGRLALIDHLERVHDRVAQAIRTAVAPEAVAASAEKTALPFQQGSPRIFVVASISGGTGSGIVLDLGYLVRKILRDLSLADENLCGLLAYCGGRNPQSRDLCVASAYALLTELNHYSSSQCGYPGDPACGLPAFTAEDAPFRHTYVVHLGEELEAEDFNAAGGKLAEYLYYNAITPAGAFFDQCRNPRQECGAATAAAPLVRTFGLSQAGLRAGDIPPSAADELCRALLARWRGAEQAEPEARPRSLADPARLLAGQFAPTRAKENLRDEVSFRAEAIGLDVARIVDQFQTAARRELDDDPESYLLSVLSELSHGGEAGKNLPAGLPPSRTILDTLDAIVRGDDAATTRRTCLESATEAYVKDQAVRLGTALRDWILSLVSLPRYRVVGAQRGCDYVAEHLRAMSHEASESLRGKLPALHALRETLLKDKHQGRDWLRHRGFVSGRRLTVDRRLVRYFSAKIEELALSAVSRVAGLILAQVVLLGDKLRNLAADLNRLAEKIGEEPSPIAAAGPPARLSPLVARVVAETIAKHRAAMVGAMERALEDDLCRIAVTENNDGRMLAPLLRQMARSLILALVKKTALREIEASCQGTPRQTAFSLQEALHEASPRLADCGGARRLLLTAPRSIAGDLLVNGLRAGGEAGPAPTVVPDTENDVLLCYEVEQLSVRRVAAALLDQRFQYVEAAARLHTRIDVRWSPL